MKMRITGRKMLSQHQPDEYLSLSYRMWFVLVLCLLTTFAATDAMYSIRVVGGSPSSIEQFPFVVQMLLDTWGDGTFQQICAANVLTVQHVLSAAHCFQYSQDTGKDYSQPQYWRARAGSSYRSYGGELLAVRSIIAHAAFNRTYYDNDIAVVVLHSVLQFGPTIGQAAVPSQGSAVPDGTKAVLLGWGAQMIGGKASEQLVAATVSMVNQEECRKRYATISATITDAMVCAGLPDVGGVDGCHGDSGGPLLYNGVVVGIVSFGYNCGSAYYPGVYVRVSHFTQWIIDTVQRVL